jgi:hypothetical protein
MPSAFTVPVDAMRYPLALPPQPETRGRDRRFQ